MNKNLDNKGFTLIEMLVVVAIVGLLSSVVVVGLTGAREQARDARRVADLREVQNDLELNYDSSSGYPETSAVEIPNDPQGNSYKYAPIDSDSNGFNESYELGACIENIDNVSSESATCSDISCSSGEGTLYCVTPN